MERLTYWCPNGQGGGEWRVNIDGREERGLHVDRLAAYEDTGLEPEEIAKIKQDVEDGYMKSTARRYGIDVPRLRELAQADREGGGSWCCLPKSNITLEETYQLGSWNKADGWIIDEWLDWEDANVAHWMPLPEPPKEEHT